MFLIIMRKFKILLLNCTSGSEPNEVRLLSEFFRMMNERYPKSIDYISVDVKNKFDLVNQLSLTWPNIIHISAHGISHKFPSGRRGKKTSIFVGDESLTSDDISELPQISRKLVTVSACYASYKDLADSFINNGVDHYLAPKTKVDWVDAGLFFVMFYKKFLYDRKTFGESFEYAREHTKLSKDFREYWYR
jgi:hypothetical protein